MFNPFQPIKWLKTHIYNKVFSGARRLADITKTTFDNGMLNIAYHEFKPVINDSSLLTVCARRAITRIVQYSINYAKENRSCTWLWNWLRELRDLLNKLDIDKKK